MKSKIIFVLTTLLSCSTVAFAQISIDKDIFDRLVDYVNCKYTSAYFENIREDPQFEKPLKIYDEKIKNEIDNVSINNPLSSDDLFNLLIKNEITNTANLLTKKIAGRKNAFDAKLSNQQLIDYILKINDLSETFQNKLEYTKSVLQVELLDIYTSAKPAEKITNPTSIPTNQHSHLLLWIIIGLQGALITTFIIFYLSSFRNKVVSFVLGSQRIKHFIIDQNNLSNNFKYTIPSSQPISEKEVNRIVELVTQRVTKNFEIKQQEKIKQNEITSEVNQVTISNIRYLKQRNGNIFNQVSTIPEGCYFELYDILDNIAKFKFSGNENYAINNKNEVFDDVCDVSGSSFNAKRVQHEESGEVALQADGKWKVIKKAKIKFI
ncbi:MAG: hypothetical protein JXA54_15925 [Candidatus Heimdallarchaeota archaeon]|nr:hypothetical protein [Candidatus Heimdallarchaeota archaeon]